MIAEVKKSGLRGKGGGGFVTANKWEKARNAPTDDKGTRYIMVNGDEGNPASYMDRSVMEGAPHQVLEGLLIGAYAPASFMQHFMVFVLSVFVGFQVILNL